MTKFTAKVLRGALSRSRNSNTARQDVPSDITTESVGSVSTTTTAASSSSFRPSSSQKNTISPIADISVISGEITIPKRCFHSRPQIKIFLQDNFPYDCQETTVASCCLQPAYICAGDKFLFALAYAFPDNVASFPKWYTLQVRVEDTHGNLVCFDHRVTVAIDQHGQTLHRIQIPLINAMIFPKDHQEDYRDDDDDDDEEEEGSVQRTSEREESKDPLTSSSDHKNDSSNHTRCSHYRRRMAVVRRSRSKVQAE